MSKRGAERTLTKDDVEAGDDEETVTEKGVFSEASEEQLSKRKFVTAKRKTTASANTGSALPKFNFGAVPTSGDNKQEEKKTEPTAAPAAAPPSAPVNNAFAKFMLQAGSWECPSCEVQNKKEDAKCKACETPNPNASGDASSSSAAPAASGFTFGIPAGSGSEPATTTTPATNGTPFSFGSNTSFATTFSTPFTFGAQADTSSATSGLTFGTIQSAGDSGFGSGGTLEFASATDTGLVTSGEIDAQFKDKTRESSGDEKDKTIHVQKDTVVYQMKEVPKKKPADTTDPTAAATAAAEAAAKPDASVEMETKYVEIGKGDLKINVFDKEDGKKGARMLLRANQTQRLVLNAPLFDQFIVSIQNDKFIRFLSRDLDLKLSTFLIKYKSKTEASDVMNAITKALDTIGAKAAPTDTIGAKAAPTSTTSSSSATSKPATTETPAS